MGWATLPCSRTFVQLSPRSVSAAVLPPQRTPSSTAPLPPPRFLPPGPCCSVTCTPPPTGLLASCLSLPGLSFLRKGFVWPPSSWCPSRHTVGARVTESGDTWWRWGWGPQRRGTQGSPSYPVLHLFSPGPKGGGLGLLGEPHPCPRPISTLWVLGADLQGCELWESGAGAGGGGLQGGPGAPSALLSSRVSVTVCV